MIAHALRAYELAQATYLQEETVARAEQERAGQLLSATQKVEQAARDLLEKAGLAHIAGAPLHLDETAAPVRRNDEAVAAAFATAQLAYTDLRTALFRLAGIYVEATCWQDAQRIVSPLLEDQEVPIYAYARDLSRQIFLNTSQAALDEGRLDEARVALQDWLDKHGDDKNLNGLLCETHYRLGKRAIQSNDWVQVEAHLRAIWRLAPAYRDTKEWTRRYPLSPWLVGGVRCIHILEHPGAVRSVAFSPDSKLLASATSSLIKLWEVGSWSELFEIPSPRGGAGQIDEVMFPDYNSVVAVWHPPSYPDLHYGLILDISSRKVQVFEGSGGRDGFGTKRKASLHGELNVEKGTRSGELVVRDEAGTELVALRHPGVVNDVDISPDGRLLASAGADGTSRIWGTEGGEPTD